MPFPLANTITSLIFANVTYLFILNAFIGILEGKLLKRWFAGQSRAVWWMIAANYLSAWIGFLALPYLTTTALLGPRPIERLNLFVAGMVLFSFTITILVELGFVHLATRRNARPFRHTLRATLAVNAISYLLICAWFLWISYSLPFNAHIRTLTALGPLPAGTLYWVDPTGHVIARHLDQTQPDQTIGQVVQNDFMKPSQLCISLAKDPQRVQIDTMYYTIQYANRPTPPNLHEPDPLLLADAGPSSAFQPEYWKQSRNLRKTVLDLRPEGHRPTHIQFDFYHQFLDTQVPNGPAAHLTIGWATLEWDIREPTVLPDEKIIFELAGQIVLFDPHTKNLAFVALGTCPAFIPAAR